MIKLMNTKLLITILGVTLLFCSCKEQTAQQPNILFIAVDDLRPDLGCYGNELVQSKNMDQLAKEGFLFKNHFVSAPTCGVSRYSLLTGRHPRTRAQLSNNVITDELADRPETKIPETFIHQLRRNGYYTLGIGKISHAADGLVYGYIDEPSQKRELPHSWDELLFDAGKWETGWNAFFGYANGENRQSLKRQVRPYENAAIADTGYVDGLTTNLAIQKLKEMKSVKQPFFMGVGFFKPHLPFNAPQRYWNLYEEATIPISPNPTIPANVHKASLHNSGEFNGYKLGEEQPNLDTIASEQYARKIRHAYYACISYIDNQIGELLTTLKTLDLYENTIIVIWGDHGWHLGDQQVWGKHTLFENALKSALILKTPNNMQAKTITSIIETVDIYPTLLDLCNVEMPYKADGESFRTLLQEENPAWNNVAYSYFRNGISLRTERYRLTKYFRKATPIIELYDHQTDPLESINIATEFPEVVNRLMPLLEKGDTGLYD